MQGTNERPVLRYFGGYLSKYSNPLIFSYYSSISQELSQAITYAQSPAGVEIRFSCNEETDVLITHAGQIITFDAVVPIGHEERAWILQAITGMLPPTFLGLKSGHTALYSFPPSLFVSPKLGCFHLIPRCFTLK